MHSQKDKKFRGKILLSEKGGPQMWQHEAEILTNEEVAPGYFWLRLVSPEIAAAAEPGQFVHVRVSRTDFPLLRRPMSIGRVDREAGTLDILYKVVGQGTQLMAQHHPGERMDLLGPLGSVFTFKPGAQRVAILGRGIGTAPLIFWAVEARRRGLEVWAFMSGRTGEMIFGREDLEPLGVHFFGGADDGSGVGANRLLELCRETCLEANVQQIITCGSRRMNGLVADLDYGHSIYAEISLEAQMGCAMGACRGCVCSVQEEPGAESSYALVCQDGPVFPARKVVFHELQTT